MTNVDSWDAENFHVVEHSIFNAENFYLVVHSIFYLKVDVLHSDYTALWVGLLVNVAQ